MIRRMLVLLGCWLLSGGLVLAQGTIKFSNQGELIDAPFSSGKDGRALGAQYVAQLGIANGLASGERAQPIGEATAFTEDGYFLGGVVTIPDKVPRARVKLIVVAFTTEGDFVGASNIVTVRLGADEVTAAPLIGLEAMECGFCIGGPHSVNPFTLGDGASPNPWSLTPPPFGPPGETGPFSPAPPQPIRWRWLDDGSLELTWSKRDQLMRGPVVPLFSDYQRAGTSRVPIDDGIEEGTKWRRIIHPYGRKGFCWVE